MAKVIRAIECPKCGSSQKVEVKNDLFRCLNCDTEYYLDTDEINITQIVNYNLTKDEAEKTKQPDKVKIFAVIGCVGFFFIMIIINSLFDTRNTTNENRVLKNESKNFSSSSRDLTTYSDQDGKPVLVVLEHRYYTGSEADDKSGEYISFYDPVENKELKTQRFSNIPKVGSETLNFAAFRNGDIYAIINKTFLFKINKNTLIAEDVTKSAFKNYSELTAGIANMEFINRDYGDGLKLMTNEGRNLFFFPLIGKLYTKEEFWEITAKPIADQNAQIITDFAFSNKSSDYPDEKIQLIKYTHIDFKGKPYSTPIFEFSNYSKDDGKEFKTLLKWKGEFVLSYNDFTKDRMYFEPNVLYSDKKYVLIKYNSGAAEQSNTFVQCLDANTAKIIFTLPLDKKKTTYGEAIRCKDGFVIKSNNTVMVVGFDGKLINEFKLL